MSTSRSDTSFRIRRRPRSETDPPFRAGLKGLLVVALIGAFIWFAITTYSGVPFVNYRTLYIDVPQVGDLIQHDPVRIAGIRVGQVSATTITRQGTVRVKLQLSPDTRIPAGTEVKIRANGLLGARYVQLIPGASSRILPDGASIDAAASSLTFGLADALNVFNQRTRGALGDTLNQLGIGLLGRGAGLNDALTAVTGATLPIKRFATAVLAPTIRTRALIPALAAGTAALAAARRSLVQMLTPTATALQPLVDQRAAVRSALMVAPSSLRSATSGFAAGQRLLESVEHLAQAANQTLPTAPAGLREATSFFISSHSPLSRTQTLLRSAQSSIPAALTLTAAINPLLGPIDHATGNLTPIVTQVGQYGCNIINFGATFRSMTGVGGTGSGPSGPAMEFRLLPILSTTDALGLPSSTAGIPDPRTTYTPPCQYLDTTYPAQ